MSCNVYFSIWYDTFYKLKNAFRAKIIEMNEKIFYTLYISGRLNYFRELWYGKH